MSGSFTPIGSGNERGNSGIRINLDINHGNTPDHVDMIVPLQVQGFNFADKIKIDAQGRIISRSLEY
ncbi:MAG: hypothetical protein COV09_00060 [Candidatus Vogelbacteria bacterium CG10_big_fil_rev_8_21_14_0_10_50_13]|uniref:Uncharacterized protein n=1 Tax=Candidatus Vogelbacteria bacterium CG10_big_fil_rev_8_21_14_0_10_50_13 TaxID=1975044 RepID=A0A2H0RGK7_9BACT|nr:MAG: hypothetical protein COV09_00060 [Candidatus Vogelbacteria bacterium CG10_big_fil_rev_8_21_14_0_10_50_13]